MVLGGDGAWLITMSGLSLEPGVVRRLLKLGQW